MCFRKDYADDDIGNKGYDDDDRRNLALDEILEAILIQRGQRARGIVNCCVCHWFPVSLNAEGFGINSGFLQIIG